MKTCTKCHNLKPLSMFHKDSSKKDGHTCRCKQCVSDHQKKNRDKYREREKAYRVAHQKRYVLNRKQKYANDAEFRERTLEAQKIRMARYLEKNPEKIKEHRKKWASNNQPLITHWVRVRQTAKQNRTPRWLTNDDLRQIKRTYEISKKQTLESGERWVVDHVIPLRGKYVSGLHVPQNLQVIKQSTNSRKSNKFDINREWAA